MALPGPRQCSRGREMAPDAWSCVPGSAPQPLHRAVLAWGVPLPGSSGRAPSPHLAHEPWGGAVSVGTETLRQPLGGGSRWG